MDMNKFARDNDLARKFEKAIETLDRGKGWEVFAGLDKGPIERGVIYDGSVRFVAVKKTPKKKARAKPRKKVKPVELVVSASDTGYPFSVDLNKTDKEEG